MQEKFWILLKSSHLFIQWSMNGLLMSGVVQKSAILILFVSRNKVEQCVKTIFFPLQIPLGCQWKEATMLLLRPCHGLLLCHFQQLFGTLRCHVSGEYLHKSHSQTFRVFGKRGLKCLCLCVCWYFGMFQYIRDVKKLQCCTLTKIIKRYSLAA